MAARDKFKMSSAEGAFSRRVAAAVGQARTLDELRFDNYSTYWRDILRFVPPIDPASMPETIAVIDSGFSAELDPHCVVDLTNSVDLTGEGTLRDGIGHGTAIASLVRLVAPSARQVHIKIMNSQRTVAGGDYAGQVATIRRAFEHAEAAKATIVNASWNYLTELDEHKPDPRPNHFCHCPICAIVVDFVKRTNVDVFVSEGNYHSYETKGRPKGSWSCPASAELAVPVIGYREGKAVYDTNLDTSAGVPAPSHLAIHRATNARTSLWRRLCPVADETITGTSFAVPLVAATLAALKMAFRDRGYERFSLPRSLDGPDGEATTAYNFALELFFVPPDDKSAFAFHEDWIVLAENCKRRATAMAKQQDPARAGALCCLLADLISVAYLRIDRAALKNVSAKYADYVEGQMAELISQLYLSGIHLLRQSPASSSSGPFVERASSILSVMRARGTDVTLEEQTLSGLRENSNR